MSYGGPTAVIWDLDGTLLDSESLAHAGFRQAFLTILDRAPTEAEMRGLTGRPAPRVLEEWFGPAVGARLFTETRRYYEEHAASVAVYDGVCDVLEELRRRGHRMGIATSKRRDLARGELTSHGLERFFQVIVGQEDTTQHKPHPAPLLQAAARLHVSPGEAAYVGDQPTDMEAARAAGMWSVAALWGGASRERLQTVSPSHLIERPDGLLVAGFFRPRPALEWE